MRTNKPLGLVFRRATCFVALIGLLFFASSAWADGKFYPPKALPASINIPDQSALLIWSNGVERLVIETRFVGEGTNFAWVVPLPSVPKIEAATTGLFPTLRTCLQPEVGHNISNLWAVALFVCSLFWLVVTVRSSGEARGMDMICCVVTAASLAFLLATGAGIIPLTLVFFFILIFSVHHVRTGRSPVLAFLAVLLLLMVLAAVLLPTLGRAGRAIISENGVTVIDRKIVGVFETTVVSATNSQELLGWLDENGFAADNSSKAVIDQHIRDGWVFAAAKVHRDTAQWAAATPHPLSFTFKAVKPVYPLRLTGTSSEHLDLDLFVVGPERAKVDGFKATECHWLVAAPDGVSRPDPVLRLNHTLFKEWAGNLPVITRLQASLTPKAMSEDATISWRNFADEKSWVYSKRGAAIVAANWSLSPIIILVLILAMRARKGRALSATGRRVVGTFILACVVSGLVVFLSLPKIEVRLVGFAVHRSESNLKQLGVTAYDVASTNRVMNLDAARQAVLLARGEMNPRSLENLLQGGVVREEDSPGNYSLHETEEGVEFIGHNGRGEAKVLVVFKKSALTSP